MESACEEQLRPKPRIAIVVYKVGPYHAARFDALSDDADVVVIELTGEDTHYAWSPIANSLKFSKVTLFPNEDSTRVTRNRSVVELERALVAVRPDVVAVNGWSDPHARIALRWCRLNFVPAVLMSDSRNEDKKRNSRLEWMKSLLVREFSSALVAGNAQKRYLRQLGMPKERIEVGLDVVDKD